MFQQILPTMSMFNDNNDNWKLAYMFFEVEKMLGREFKMFNLLICNGEGQYFSSSDDRLELVKYIKKHQLKYKIKDIVFNKSIQYYDYDMAYDVFSKNSEIKNYKRFFMYINLSGEDETRHGKTIKDREWVCWNEYQ